jgi:hypothetical protein
VYVRFHNDAGLPALQVFAGVAPVGDLLDPDFHFDSTLPTLMVERFQQTVSSGQSGSFYLSRTYARPPQVRVAVNNGAVAYGARNYRSYWAGREASGYPFEWSFGAPSSAIWATAAVSQINWGVIGFSGLLTVIALIVPGVNR